MIKVKATAVIHYISPVIDIPSKNGSQPFQKRELVLNDSWERDGKQYPNFVVMEFSGDKISQLDNFMPGHRVTVEAFINGRENNGRFYNTIRGQSIVHYQPQPAIGYPVAQGYVPAPGYTPTQGYAAPSGYGSSPMPAPPYPAQQMHVPPTLPQSSKTPGVDDLPFPPPY